MLFALEVENNKNEIKIVQLTPRWFFEIHTHSGGLNCFAILYYFSKVIFMLWYFNVPHNFRVTMSVRKFINILNELSCWCQLLMHESVNVFERLLNGGLRGLTYILEQKLFFKTFLWMNINLIKNKFNSY